MVYATSKKVQTTKGAEVDAVRALMNVMCTELFHTKHHGILGRWEESFGVEVERSPFKDSRIKFLRTFVEDVQTRFNEFRLAVFRWRVGLKQVWCSCERVFSYVTAIEYG